MVHNMRSENRRVYLLLKNWNLDNYINNVDETL